MMARLCEPQRISPAAAVRTTTSGCSGAGSSGALRSPGQTQRAMARACLGADSAAMTDDLPLPLKSREVASDFLAVVHRQIGVYRELTLRMSRAPTATGS